MSDIARLGLAIDSSQVVAANKELDKLQANAKKTEQATQSLGQKAGEPLGAIQAAARRAGVSVDEMRDRIARAQRPTETALGKVAQAAQQTSAALGGGSGKGGSPSGGDDGGLGGAADKANSKMTNLANTLTRRFVVGYAVSQIRLLATTLGSLNGNVARAGDIGKLTGIGAGNTQGIISAAGASGIDNKTISEALVAFNQQIPLAKAGVGQLGELFRANRVTVTDTNDAFFKFADLVKNAKDDTARLSMLQQAGLPATLEMVRFFSQGADRIREMADEAPKLTDSQVEAARRVRDEWNRTWQSFLDRGTLAVSGILKTFEGLDDAATRFLMKLPFIGSSVPTNILANALAGNGNGTRLTPGMAGSFYDAVGMGRGRGFSGGSSDGAGGGSSKDWATEKQIAQDRINKQQIYLGLLGQTTTAEEARRQVQLQADAAALQGVGIDKQRLETLKRLAAEQAIGLTAIKASTDAARTEAMTVGMDVGQAAAFTAAQNALNDARRNGRVLTDENKSAIEREAQALGEATQRADNLRFGYDTFSGSMRELGQLIRSGTLSWRTFGQVASNALGKIADRLMDMASRSLWQMAFPSGGGGLLKLFGFGGGASTAGLEGYSGVSPEGVGLLHTGAGPGETTGRVRYVHPAYFDDAPRFHTGIGPGERKAIIRNDESVLTPGQMGQLAPVGSGGVTIQNHYEFHGVKPGMEAELKAYIDQGDRNSIEQAVSATGKTFATNQQFNRNRR